MLKFKTYYVDTTKGVDIINIGFDIRRAIKEDRFDTGFAVVTIPYAGAGFFIMEPETPPADLKKGLETLLSNPVFKHFLCKSLTLSVEKGRLTIEPWQEVFLIDYETSGRRREFRVQTVWEQAPQSPGGGMMPPQPPQGLPKGVA